jgi:hypothetical protein
MKRRTKKMAQILKVRKKILKAARSKSGVIYVQNKDLQKYIGKEVVIRVAIE